MTKNAVYFSSMPDSGKRTLFNAVAATSIQTVARIGRGISELFTAPAKAVRKGEIPHPQPPNVVVKNVARPDISLVRV